MGQGSAPTRNDDARHFDLGGPSGMAVATRPNRVLAAAARYRAAFLADPSLADCSDGDMVWQLREGSSWALQEYTERGREAGVVTDEEAATVRDAMEFGQWKQEADVALRCAIVQLVAELLGAGA